MPFDRPTLSELVTRVRADFRSRLGISGQLVRRAMADVVATVFAGAVHMLHGHLVWISEQIFADTAEGDFLARIASFYGIERTAATFAKGNIEVTGSFGTLIPKQTVYVRDDGVTYETTADVFIGLGITVVNVVALEAGANSNLGAGETLTLESPIVGVDSDATVDSQGISGGSDEETDEELRARLLQRLRDPPTGGSDQDYIAWALSIAGVTRAWVFRHENGLGTVTVRFVRDNDVPIFPDAGEVTTVQDYIDSQRPTTAEVTVEAPTQLDVDFDIALDPDTTAIRDEVAASLTELLQREGEPGDGLGAGTILLSQIRTAIGVAVGDGDYTLTDPVADVVPAVGELPVLGTITWS